MAHADYNCCACCDKKMEYNPDAEAKTVLCSECAVNLTKRCGVDITSPETLRQWAEDADWNTLKDTLLMAGYKFCYYPNDLDNFLLTEKKILMVHDNKDFVRDRTVQP